MTDPLTQALVRRERLLANIARQRVELVDTVSALSVPIAVADRAIGAGRVIRSHPIVFGAIAVAIFVLRGRGITGMVARVLGLWRSGLAIRGLMARLGF
jgi:hypothetical protein